MTIFTKLSALIASAALLTLTSYSNNSFAHPPGGHEIPKKYRTVDQSDAQPETETITSAKLSKDYFDAQKADASDLSKECQAIMKNMKVENDEDGKSVDVKDLKARIQKCMVDTKSPALGEK